MPRRRARPTTRISARATAIRRRFVAPRPERHDRGSERSRGGRVPGPVPATASRPTLRRGSVSGVSGRGVETSLKRLISDGGGDGERSDGGGTEGPGHRCGEPAHEGEPACARADQRHGAGGTGQSPHRPGRSTAASSARRARRRRRASPAGRPPGRAGLGRSSPGGPAGVVAHVGRSPPERAGRRGDRDGCRRLPLGRGRRSGVRRHHARQPDVPRSRGPGRPRRPSDCWVASSCWRRRSRCGAGPRTTRSPDEEWARAEAERLEELRATASERSLRGDAGGRQAHATRCRSWPGRSSRSRCVTGSSACRCWRCSGPAAKPRRRGSSRPIAPGLGHRPRPRTGPGAGRPRPPDRRRRRVAPPVAGDDRPRVGRCGAIASASSSARAALRRGVPRHPAVGGP